MATRNRAIVTFPTGGKKQVAQVKLAADRLCTKWGIPRSTVHVEPLKRDCIAHLGPGDKLYVIGHGNRTNLGRLHANFRQ